MQLKVVYLHLWKEKPYLSTFFNGIIRNGKT